MIQRQRNKKRRWSDYICNGMTYGASAISTIVLAAILCFVFIKGASSIRWDLFVQDYWSSNYSITIETDKNKTGEFEVPTSLDEDAYFSKKWGIVLKDEKDGEESVVMAQIVPDSPFHYLLDQSVKNNISSFQWKEGLMLEKLDYVDKQGNTSMAGSLFMQNAEDIVKILDEDVTQITSMYVKTKGGGIRGSIISTFYLLGISLLFALPIGVSAALYLHEYARKNKVCSWLRSMIEMLTGVPSILYGLMGVSVLFPVTQMFGATTTNLLLGGLTLAILLLPTIIRSTEEALRVIPQSLRDGSLSLGATSSQTIFKVVLPCAIPGILTGVLLSIGRVIGESAALIYTIGTFINDSPGLLTQGTSLAVHIWSMMNMEQPNFEMAAAISLIILAFVCLLNISMKILSKYWYRKWN